MKTTILIILLSSVILKAQTIDSLARERNRLTMQIEGEKVKRRVIGVACLVTGGSLLFSGKMSWPLFIIAVGAQITTDIIYIRKTKKIKRLQNQLLLTKP